MKKETTRSTIFDMNGVPNFKPALPLAIQHVVAMIVGCVTPAIIIAGVAGLSEEQSVILIQASLVVSALSTLFQLFPFVKTKWLTLGSGLPIIMGVSFAYLPSMQAIAGDYDIATILGAQIVGGFVAIFVGLFIKKIRKFFPPLIAGTVVFTIGLSLYPTAIKYMAGGAGQEGYGSVQNWVVALITLAIVTALNHYGKGIFKLASILIGMVAGYIIALCLGMVDFSPLASAAVFQLPKPYAFGVKFEISACIAIGLLFAINSIQAIGDFSATTSGGLDRMPTDNELQGGIVRTCCCHSSCSWFNSKVLFTPYNNSLLRIRWCYSFCIRFDRNDRYETNYFRRNVLP
jgi:NCS2 family nucleobase:cation symporter-2